METVSDLNDEAEVAEETDAVAGLENSVNDVMPGNLPAQQLMWQLMQMAQDGSEVTTADAQSQELMREIAKAKTEHPSNFPSYWEMDEEDVKLATEEEIQNDPAARTLWAAENGELVILTSMLDDQPDMLQCSDEDGYTPLHRASYNGHTDVLQLLLTRGANVDARTNDGWTALHSACYWGQAQAATILLSHGAEVNSQTKGLQTPLHLAASNSDRPGVVELLLLHPLADHSMTNSMGDTAADIAKRSGRFYYLYEMTSDSINKLSPD